MDKLNLIIPNPTKHQYVVGIDIGHGETSAAICELEWNKDAGRTEQDVADVRINPANTGNEKVMVSAISQVGDDDPKIGEDAFAAEQLEDGAYIKVCFKQPPVSIENKEEQLMILYMKAVYERIRRAESRLTDGNHVVYIARPSGWVDEGTKELYRQMALQAGIPLAGLTSESRAAIFYAINHPRVGFAKEIEKGAIVFDLGSSTLDFTYLAQDTEPIDYGYPHGASIVEKAIYKHCIEPNEGVQLLLKNHPQYKDALLFKAREAKEAAYNKREDLEIDKSFMLRQVVASNCSDFSALKREFIEICFGNINELNEILENKEQYISSIKEDLNNFRAEWIKNKPLNGVFLTGGASRMGFIKEIIKDTYNLSEAQVKIDPDNPSLTISRGIAMLGRADCVSGILQKELEKKAKNIDVKDFYAKFVEKLATLVGEGSWSVVEKQLAIFKNASDDRSVNSLEISIRMSLEHYIKSDLGILFMNSLRNTIESETENIRQELNKIISIYAPGRELKKNHVKMLSFDNQSVLSSIKKQVDTLVGSITEQVTSNIGKIVGDILWAALGLFLFGLFYVGYKLARFGWDRFNTTEAERKAREEKEEREKKEKAKARSLGKSDRKKVYDKVMEEKMELKEKLIAEIRASLQSNRSLHVAVEPQLKAYSEVFIKDNINSVRIPIE